MAKQATQTASRQNAESAVGARRASEASTRQNARSENEMRGWQQALGNQAMQRSLLAGTSKIPRLLRKCASCAQHDDQAKAGVIQTKLTINEPGDVFEQEADRIADTVMRMSENGTFEWAGGPSSTTLPRVQRVCQECEQELQRAPNKLQRMYSNGGARSNIDPELENNLQAKEVPGTTPEISAASSAQIYELRGSGQALPNTERGFFESRFGQDFSGVRVHIDNKAAESARQIHALAYTTGSSIVFGAGQFHPGTAAGRRLIAHELAHVVQQRGSRARPTAGDAGHPLTAKIGGTPSTVQRMGDPTQAPKTLACPIPTTSSASPVDTNVLFGLQSNQLTAKAIADIADFATRWNAAGANRLVRVDGFASTDGPQSLNWTLSCQRAQTVSSELEAPSGGSKGVTANFIDIFAQGETSEFSSSLEPNRRATIRADLSAPPPPAPCANPGTVRDLDLQPVFLRTGPADTSPTGGSWARRFNEANVIWGKLGVTFHDLGAITLDTPLKTNGTTIPERDAVAALRSGAGVEVFLVDNDMASAGGASTRPPGTPLCDGNIVMSDRGTSDTLLAHELGHELGIGHPGSPVNPGDVNTIMVGSGSHSTANSTRNTMANLNKILCPPGSASTCLNPDP